METQKNKERETNPKSLETKKKKKKKKRKRNQKPAQSIYAIKSEGKGKKETYLKGSNHRMQKLKENRKVEQIGEEEVQSND